MSEIHINEIYNEDCIDFMDNMAESGLKIDIVLTSPPYNIGIHQFDYDVYKDKMDSREYSEFIICVLNKIEKILSANGVILWNSSFGRNNISDYFNLVSRITKDTSLDIADRIIWKKKSAYPDNLSSNGLTRIVEDVFVFCRKSEIKTYRCNKKVLSIRKTGQKVYTSIFNFIEAANNDGGGERLNHAQYSSELCRKLLSIYARKEDVVFDPFSGTGTTELACKQMGLSYIGCELSAAQVEYARKRVDGDNNLDSLPLFKY